MRLGWVLTALIAAAGAVATAGGAANAAVQFSLSSGTSGGIPDNDVTNNLLLPLGFDDPLGGYFGATVSLIGGTAPIKVEFLGFEASNINKFYFDNVLLFSTTGGTSVNPGQPYVIVNPVDSDPLNFKFKTSTGGEVENADNPQDGGEGPTGVNFFSRIAGADPDAVTGTMVYLFFDDNGANNDDNHDDMLIKLSIVPLPATLPLLFGALAGLGFLRSRGRLS